MMRRLLLLVTLIAASAGILAASASADYGRGTVFQVEISANDVHGGNFWFWAALGPGQESDYQNTDCIHQTAGGNPGATVGAAHSSGELTGWSDTNGIIEMDGVKIVGGLATANFYVMDARHSSWFKIIVTSEVVPVLPLNVPLIWSGQGTQVTVAP